MKILVVGDSPTVKTGFSRVCEQICLGLHQRGHEVVLLGVNDLAEPHNYPFYIYPAFTVSSQDALGLRRLPTVVTKEQPDAVLLFNDCWVCEQYFLQIEKLYHKQQFKCFAYFPVDSHGYVPGLVKWLNEIDGVATYTEFGVQVLRAAKFRGDVQVFPHGVDTKTFYPVPKAEARAKLGLDKLKDGFIVLNANRNQPRKRIDLTIKAFAEFAVDRPDAWLYLHMGCKDIGWDIIPLFEREMRLRGNCVDRLVLTEQTMGPLSVPEEMLNYVYNAADVCVNTSLGEGWGLTNTECAMCDVPQVVPNHSACKEIWGDGRGLLIDVADWQTDLQCLIERGAVDTSHLAKQLGKLYDDRSLGAKLASEAKAYLSSDKFTWEEIVSSMERWLTAK
jgi:glycosyltransferase involved in cell wall biosynthesis